MFLRLLSSGESTRREVLRLASRPGEGMSSPEFSKPCPIHRGRSIDGNTTSASAKMSSSPSSSSPTADKSALNDAATDGRAPRPLSLLSLLATLALRDGVRVALSILSGSSSVSSSRAVLVLVCRPVVAGGIVCMVFAAGVDGIGWEMVVCACTDRLSAASGVGVFAGLPRPLPDPEPPVDPVFLGGILAAR